MDSTNDSVIPSVCAYNHYHECITNLSMAGINATFIVTALATLLISSTLYKKATGAHVPLLPFHRVRWTITLILLLLHVIEVGDTVLLMIYEKKELQHALHMLLHALSSGLATVMAISLYHHSEQNRKVRMLVLLMVFWPICICGRVAKLYALYEKGANMKHLCIQYTWMAVVLTCVLLVIELYLCYILRYLNSSGAKPIPTEDESDFWAKVNYKYYSVPMPSQVTFSWMVRLLRLGYERPLEQGDLGHAPQHHSNDFQYERFNKVLKEDTTKATEKNDSKISLFRCYLKTYYKTLLFAALIKAAGDICALIGPLSIKLILDYVQNERAGQADHEFPTILDLFTNGYVLAVGVLIATFLQSTLSNNFQHITTMEGVHAQSALKTAVYKKALRLNLMSADIGGEDLPEDPEENRPKEGEGSSEGSSKSSTESLKQAREQNSIGAIINHMSTDCSQVMMLFTMSHHIWMIPFKVGLLLFLIYQQLGYSAILASSTIFIISPIQYLISRIMSRIQTDAMHISDERIKKTTELIQGIKLLKILGWENIFLDKVKEIREREYRLLKKDTVCVAMNTFLTMTSSVLLPLLTFGVYTCFEGKPLDAGSVFAGLALFNQLTVPLFIVPFVIPVIISSIVSTRRLEDFLSRPEVEHTTPWSTSQEGTRNTDWLQSMDASSKDPPNGNSDSTLAISLVEATLEWIKGVEVLRDVNVSIPSRKLTIVAGPCGSGKTTLLSCFIGELQPSKGVLEYSTNIGSYVAYVPQKAWLINDTLRDNIVFGRPFEYRRYQEVVKACALLPDLETLPAGDMTEIGERGANLSGGQRQRIALARAIYSNARLLILDDPLSALDAHVTRHVFDEAIKKLLVEKKRTVVMVTHKKDYLPYAHHLVMLHNHKVRAQGSYQEVQQEDPHIIELLDTAPVESTGAPMKMRARTRTNSHLETHNDSVGKLRNLQRQMMEFEGTTEILADTTFLESSFASRSYNQDRKQLDLSNSLVKSLSPVKRRRTGTTGSFAVIHEKEEISEETLMASGPVDVVDAELWRVTEDEDRCQGTVSASVYSRYIKACGIFASFVSILLFVGMQTCKMLTDFWLSRWTDISNTTAGVNGPQTAAEDEATTRYYLIVYASISSLHIALSLAANLAAQLTTIAAVKPLHNNMLKKVVACRQRFFDQNPVGRIINRFSGDMNTIDRKLPNTIPVLLRFLLTCLSVIVVNVIVTPYFIIVVAIVFGVYWYLQHFFRASSRELQRLECITRSPIVSHFSETLNGLPTIRAYREEEVFIKKLHKLVDINNMAFIMLSSANCWLGISLDYLGGSILFFATVTSMTAALAGWITPSLVGLTMTYTLLVPVYLNWLVKNMTSLEMYMSSVERVQNYIELIGEVNAEQSEERNVIPNEWPSRGEVTFKNVSMKYDTSNDLVLEDIDITFKPGEKVGLCGRSGSGKSSLVMGLFQMVPVTEGEILIDGRNLALEDPHEVRSHLSMIPQDPILFEGTVRFNLDPEGKYSEEQLWYALEKAYMKDAISKAGGLDAEINEEGSNLSSGQKQLFCLARSILNPSRVLVLDEATSSLESTLDDKIHRIIRDVWSDATVIAIAHRVTSIEKFDKVIVLEQGRIVEAGDPQQLKENPLSAFAALLRSYQR